MPTPRSNLARTAIRAMRLLRARPQRRADLMASLEISRATADRILRVIADEGEPISVERRGRDAWYSLR